MKLWCLGLTVLVVCLGIGFRLEGERNAANFIWLANRSLQKAQPAFQGALVVVPGGYAYIPIMFKDENTYNRWTRMTGKPKQWTEKGFGEQGYYDISRLFVPAENSKTE